MRRAASGARRVPGAVWLWCAPKPDIIFPRLNFGGKERMSEPTREELMARIAELEKKGSRAKGSIEFRVGEKGGVSVYGLGRFPVTLYYEQWVRLLDAAGDLRTFLEENKSRLKLKPAE
jgi:hypothetical protein